VPLLSANEIANMRGEVLGTSLDMVCTIQRRTASGNDPANQPDYTWANHLTNVPCHFWKTADDELVGIQNVTVAKQRLVLQADVDVTTADIVTSIKDIDGSENLIADSLDIVEVIHQINHTMLIVWESK
jgi:hypothetical protein